ncbi:MAG TPA: helix-turn-helix domain-containing protein [Candidatus Fournierella excrementigallinarum]|nr:helix-turn-helix domain-containing protein [Candidatus Fournierella excrementigallinarum]
MPTVDMVRTGQNINRLRKQTGLSTADLQAALGLASPRAIFKWQRGDCLPTVDNLVVLAALFGVRIDDIPAIDAAG